MTLEIIRGHPKPPVGGHHLPYHSQTFRGRDVDDLIAKLTYYRTQNSLPLGNPEAEVAAYYATMAPHLVRDSDYEPEVASLRQKVAEHTMAVWYGKYERMPHHETSAAERLVVCTACAQRRTGFSEPESAYSADAFTKATLMTGDMHCSDKGHCAHHHWLLGLATRLVSPEKVATMPVPAGCWVQAP